MRISIHDQSKIRLRHGLRDDNRVGILVSGPVSEGGGGGGGGDPVEDFVETTGPETCGSFVLQGNRFSSVNYNPNSGLDFGTGPFTIEWWQYQTDNNPFPRVFARGTYGATTLGLSIEGGSAYFWDAGANYLSNLSSYKNSWQHFAVTRSINNKLRFFRNGQLLTTIEDYSHNFLPSTEQFKIGVEGTPSDASSFGGNITNFHIMKGAARYIAPFTPSTSPLKMTNRSILMLYAPTAPDAAQDATNTTSGLGSNITWSSSNPFS